MAMTREQKIAAIRQKRAESTSAQAAPQPLSREDKIAKIREARSKEDSTPGIAETLAVSGAQGATLGSLPLVMGLSAGKDAFVRNLVKGEGLDAAIEQAKNYFTATRKGFSDKQEEVRKANPVAATVGNIAGGLATAPFTGPLGLIGGGTAIGGSVGFNEALSKGESLEDAAIKGAKGAGFGLATAGAIKGAGNIISKAGGSKFAEKADDIANSLKQKSSQLGLKATGATPSKIEKLQSIGRDGEKAQRVGRRLIDEGIIKSFSTPKGALKRINRIVENLSEDLDELYNNPAINQRVVSSDKIADRVMKEVRDDIVKEFGDQSIQLPGTSNVLKNVEAYLDDFRGATLTPKEAWQIRKTIDKGIKVFYKQDTAGGAADINKRLRFAINDEIGAALDDMNIPGATKKDLLDINQRFSDLISAQDLIKKGVSRQENNRFISLTDTIAAAGGASTGNPGTALMLGGLNKGIRTFGSGISAKALDRAGNVLSGKVPGGSIISRGLINPDIQRTAIGQATRDLVNKSVADDEETAIMRRLRR